VSVSALRAILGNSVRFFIVIPPRQERPYSAHGLSAEWTCGCVARGESFQRLTPVPCDAHRDALLGDALQGNAVHG